MSTDGLNNINMESFKMIYPELDKFYNYQELTEYIFAVQKEKPEFMKIASLATTPGGRSLWSVTLSNTENHADKPAMCIHAGTHSEEGVGITCALNFIAYVLENPQILDEVTIYVLPNSNPDGTDRCVNEGLRVRSNVLDEDIPADNCVHPRDLNGDGKILQMRWLDPMGNYKIMPECGDMLVPREVGDVEGPFYSVCIEGDIESYAGGSPESAYRGIDYNRQYAAGWMPLRQSGDYAGQYIEPRTVMDFLISHPNIFANIDLHCGFPALLYEEPKNAEDGAILTRLSKLCEKMVGLPVTKESSYGQAPGAAPTVFYGCHDGFCLSALGIISLAPELGGGHSSVGMTSEEMYMTAMSGFELSADTVAKMKVFQDKYGRKMAEPWTPYDHPVLGKVEIGGRIFGNAYYINPDDMIEVCTKMAPFMMEIAKMHPELKLGNLTCERMGGDIVRVRACAMNVGALSTKVMQGVDGYNANKHKVRMTLEGGEIVSRQPVISKAQLKSMHRMEAEWFVKAKAGEKLTVTASNPKGGVAKLTCIVE